jgi:hypothetical protein
MTGIIPLVRHAWEASFGRPDIAKKAVANRGWGPLNYVLLDSPDLVRDDRQNIPAIKRKIDQVSQEEEVEANHDGQVASGYLAMIFRCDGLRKKLEEQHKEDVKMSDKYNVLKEKTNWTLGKLCSNGIVCLTNKKVLSSAQEMDNKKRQKQQDTDEYNENKERNKRQRLQEAIRRFKASENLCRDDHLTIIQKYHDEKNDLKISGKMSAATAKEHFESWGREQLTLILLL